METEYPAHPAAEIFPMMSGPELQALADDIEAEGLASPIELFNGQILDGRNRLAACRLVEVEPEFTDVTEGVTDPVQYVLSANLRRRHLNEAQKATVAAKVLDYHKAAAKERQGTSTGGRNPQLVANFPQADNGKARDKAGEALGVSGKSVDSAKAVLDKGSPALRDAVEKGKTAISSAATVAKSYTPEEQDEIVARGEKAGNVKASIAEAAKRVHVSNNSGENEWYTPPEYLKAAREVLGVISLDPASSELAQKTVKATDFYTIDDDGLSRDWFGSVWLNPPYASGLIERFTEKLCDQIALRNVSEAILLVNNATETKWFQAMIPSVSAICFTRGRIRFLDKSGEPNNSPLQGQVFAYFGKAPDVFCDVFSRFGNARRFHG